MLRKMQRLITNVQEGVDFAKKVGYPVTLRSSFALGQSGHEICEGRENIVVMVTHALDI